MKKAFILCLALMLGISSYAYSAGAFDEAPVVITKSASLEDIARISQLNAGKVAVEKASTTGVVRINLLNVRSEPWGNILGVITEGTAVNITGIKGDWYQITYNGQTAYTHSKWIVVAGKTRNIPDYGTLKSATKVMLNPGSDAVETLAAGARIEILGESGNYWRIKYNGYEAYVAKNDVSGDAVPNTSSYVANPSSTSPSNSSSSSSTPLVVVPLNNGKPQKGIFDITDKTGLVGICYSTWFDPVIEAYAGRSPKIIQDCLDGKTSWDPVGQFHYWGKPALGFYKSTDKNVIRKHMTMLSNAGIDFIVLDNTNVQMTWKDSSYWTKMVDNPGKALLDTIVEMRASGLQTPYVVNWIGGDNRCVNAIYNKFYTDSKYKECWVYWNNKPLILTTKLFSGLPNTITTRMMWGLKSQRASEWSFLNHPNVVTKDANGKAEQICVCVALQRDYMTNASRVGRRGGKTFNEQWKNAFAARPKVVTITWWNEWCAQRFAGNVFVDNYTKDYSRDIEPMSGGHGDKYYKWMCQYIAAYKGNKPCPTLID